MENNVLVMQFIRDRLSSGFRLGEKGMVLYLNDHVEDQK